MNLAKALSLVLAAAVILNFVGLVLKIIKPATFWLVAVIAAIVAYLILPRLKR